MRRAALALLVVGWALTLWLAPWSDERVNDLFVYRGFVEPLLDGGSAVCALSPSSIRHWPLR